MTIAMSIGSIVLFSLIFSLIFSIIFGLIFSFFMHVTIRASLSDVFRSSIIDLDGHSEDDNGE